MTIEETNTRYGRRTSDK